MLMTTVANAGNLDPGIFNVSGNSTGDVTVGSSEISKNSSLNSSANVFLKMNVDQQLEVYEFAITGDLNVLSESTIDQLNEYRESVNSMIPNSELVKQMIISTLKAEQ